MLTYEHGIAPKVKESRQEAMSRGDSRMVINSGSEAVEPDGKPQASPRQHTQAATAQRQTEAS